MNGFEVIQLIASWGGGEGLIIYLFILSQISINLSGKVVFIDFFKLLASVIGFQLTLLLPRENKLLLHNNFY